MKSEEKSKMKLGIFVTIGLALFVGAIYFIGTRQHLFTRTFIVSGIFKNVSGLQVGNNVRFSGINVGTVDNIEIIGDSTVKVDMVIEKKTQKFIKTDAIAMIGSEGLMGNKVINLGPGSSNKKQVENKTIIATATTVSIDDLFASLKISTDNAALITTDLADVMENIHSGRGTVGKLFMDTVFSENLNQTMINARNATGGLNENMKAAQNNVLLKGYFKKKEKEAEKLKNQK